MSIDAMINYGQAKIGKVTYSMKDRLGEWSMDCSSFVFKALMAGGFLAKGTRIGNTETLFGLNGKLFEEISFSQVKRGDIFVAGHKGASNGSAGHTGIHLGAGKIMHCTYGYHSNNIAITQAIGWMGDYSGLPVRHFRIKGAGVVSSDNAAQMIRIALDGQFGPNTARRLQEIYAMPIRDGVISGQIRTRANSNVYSARFGAGGSNVIKAIQRRLGVTVDGNLGPQTVKAMQRKLGTTVDGVISPQSDMVLAMQRKLNANKKPF